MEQLELSILNGVTKYKKIALDFSTSISYDVFSSPDAKTIAKIFTSYIGCFKSCPTKLALLDREDGPEKELISSFFSQVEKVDYDDNNYAFEVKKLKDVYSERKLSELAKTLSNSDLSIVKPTVTYIEKQLSQIKSVDGTKAYDRKTIDQYVDQYKELYKNKRENPDLGKGLLTGYSFLDYIKNGLRPSDLVLIAGETGAGKSMFMANIAKQLWMQTNTIYSQDEYAKGCNVVYFSLEMPYEDCFQRTLAMTADVPSYKLRDAKLSSQEAKAVSEACKFMKRYPYKFDIVDVPRGFSVDQLNIMFEEIKSDYNPDVVVIDYLGLMEDMESQSDDWLALGKLAGKVHEFGRAYSIPVISAVQLNRIDPNDKKSQAKAVGLHRIGRSSLVAHHASMIIQIETRADEEMHDDFLYHIIKNRHGQSGIGHRVMKNFNHCTITDVPYTEGQNVSDMFDYDPTNNVILEF